MENEGKTIPGKWHSTFADLRQEKALIIQENDLEPASGSG